MQPRCEQNVDPMLHVVEETQDVFINRSGVLQISMEVVAYMIRNYNNQNINEVAFNRHVRLSSEFHPTPDDPRAADWLFVLNTLNFRLWTPKNVQEWRVNGLTDYMALCAAVKKTIDDGLPIWNPQFYTDISIYDMMHIFRGDDENVIPYIHQRIKLLQDVGKILLEEYKGTFAECIKSCQCNVENLINTLRKFPSYDDRSRYGDVRVDLCNKALILATDIWSFFDSKHELGIRITRKLPTIFADYRVPQVLNHFNALVYSKNFLDKLEEKDEFMVYGSREELEIRCCSLMIVRHVTSQVMRKCHFYKESMPELKLPGFDCMCLVDNFLWDYRQIHDKQLKKNVLCKISTEQY